MDEVNCVRTFEERCERLRVFRPRKLKFYKRRFDPYVELPESEFRKKYRFSKANMLKIVNMLRPDLLGDRRDGYVNPELQVAAAIRSWGRSEIQDDCADMHGFSQPLMSLIQARVAKALASKHRRFINMPLTLGSQEEAMMGFSRLRGFPSVIGAIDCTHIRIPRVGGDAGQYYVNRKNFFSINVQVICGPNLKINDIVAHWRGSTHDSRIFNESRIKRRFENGEFRGRLLGDSGYACTPYLFTPILNPANEREESYNRAQIATRNPIERCFGVWKQRFRCLLTGMTGSLSTIKTTIVALAVLHNLALELHDNLDDEDIEEPSCSGAVPATIALAEDVAAMAVNVAGSVARRNFITQHF